MLSPTTHDPVRRAAPPTPAEVDAMLHAATVAAIQHDLAPEPMFSAEMGWTMAAVAVGAAAGCFGAGLTVGGWLAALAGTTLGAAAGGVFAVALWRASDGDAPLGQPLLAPRAATDDLLTGW